MVPMLAARAPLVDGVDAATMSSVNLPDASGTAGGSWIDELSKGQHELEKEIAIVQPYRRPWWKMVIYLLLGVCSGGFVWLLGLWSTNVRALLTLRPCALADAEFVYVELKDKRSAICKIRSQHAPGLREPARYFVFHTVRFLFSEARAVFVPVPTYPHTLGQERVAAHRAVAEGKVAYSPAPVTRQRRELLYGPNLLHVEAPAFAAVFAHDAMQPFYVFQYASVVVWMYEAYYIYSIIVLIITLASITTNAISQYTERKRMAELAHYVCEVELVRSALPAAGTGSPRATGGTPGVGGNQGPNGHTLVESSALVPGDVIVVSPGKVPCDCVLLEGECVVDETVLTGESVPVRKASYDPELDGHSLDPDASPHCCLFNGTTVAAARGSRGRPVLALVASTGFNTSKGRLLRTIMFPKEHQLQFAQQALYFIGLMLVMALGFYVWDVVAMVRFHSPAAVISVKALDMITVAVPPALACCLAIATTIAVGRLRRRSVYVADNERVAVAGLLDAVAFDKTGTLTEIGLELGNVVPIGEGGRFAPPESDPSALPSAVLELFATCHGLTQLEDTVVGDPLDQRLFEASGFEMRFEEGSQHQKAQTGVPRGGGQGGEASPAPAAAAATGGAQQQQQHSGPQLTVRRRRVPPPPEPAPVGDSSVHGGDQILQLHQHAIVMPLAPPEQQQQQLQAVQMVPVSHTASGSGADPVPGARHAHEYYEEQYGSKDGTAGMGAVTTQGPGFLHKLASIARGDVGDEADAGEYQPETVSASVHQRPEAIDPKHRHIELAHGRFDKTEAIRVLRRFDFSSDRMRSTCVVQRPDGRLTVFVKGSPERLLTIMAPGSVPHDFSQVLQGATNSGLRVIGLAARELPPGTRPSDVAALNQEALEAGAECLGFVFMVNRLKPDSAPTIAALHAAAIRTAMVTGDHVRTAVSVARQCNIMESGKAALVVDVGRGALHEAPFTFELVEGAAAGGDSGKRARGDAAGGVSGGIKAVDMAEALRMAAAGEVQVAVTGRGYQKAYAESSSPVDGQVKQLFEVLLQRGSVFARMSPDHKRSLIEMLGEGEVDPHTGAVRPGQGHYTGYCGDGANDLGALKGALVGVSLCDAEASIAAPMTARTDSIAVVQSVIAEGRCSLVTSLIIFKYTMVYAFIQILSLALLYNRGITVGNYQYLIQDMFHTTVLASCMGLTGPASKLSPERPLSRILSAGVILPVAAQLLVDTGFQLAALAALNAQSWFTPFDTSANKTLDIPTSEKRHEAGVLFIMGCWQLIINALVFNVGRPFRAGLWTNRWLLGALLALAAFNTYVVWAPGDPFRRRGPAVPDMPLAFRAILFGLIAANLVAAYLADAVAKGLYAAGEAGLARYRGSPTRDRRLQAAASGTASRGLARQQQQHLQQQEERLVHDTAGFTRVRAGWEGHEVAHR